MTFPTWDSEGQKAINSLPTWGKMFASADQEIAFKLKLASVLASGWALGKSMQECESEARRRLMEGE